MSSIVVYDCTLRDGMQGEGMSLSVEEKLRVAHVLDDLGVHMIEAGNPASIIGTPRSSRMRATRTFSSTDKDIPSPCMPSRRVVS